jgi:hypothetical protein
MDGHGPYQRHEWTSHAHIGWSFEDVVLTAAEYHRVEDAYVTTAIAFLREAALTVTALANPRTVELPFSDGSVPRAGGDRWRLGRVLWEEFWCRLEGIDACLHVDTRLSHRASCCHERGFPSWPAKS